MNIIPAGTDSPVTVEWPGEYVDFLRLADGGIFGRVVVFDAQTVERMQFYADEVDGRARSIGRDRWFCFGKVNEDPLFLEAFVLGPGYPVLTSSPETEQWSRLLKHIGRT